MTSFKKAGQRGTCLRQPSEEQHGQVVLKSCDTVESDALGQTFNLTEIVESAVGINSVDSDRAYAGIQGVQVLAIGADADVEIGRTLGSVARMVPAIGVSAPLEPMENPATVKVPALST